MAVGGAVGYGLARLAIVAPNRLQLEYDGLYPVFTGSRLSCSPTGTTMPAAAAFSRPVAGLVMGQARFVHEASPTSFPRCDCLVRANLDVPSY